MYRTDIFIILVHLGQSNLQLILQLLAKKQDQICLLSDNQVFFFCKFDLSFIIIKTYRRRNLYLNCQNDDDSEKQMFLLYHLDLHCLGSKISYPKVFSTFHRFLWKIREGNRAILDQNWPKQQSLINQISSIGFC